jgi:hypothetical protein
MPNRLRTVVPAPSQASIDEFSTLMSRYQNSVQGPSLASFASNLGVTEASLLNLGVGRKSGAWTFPMWSARGVLIGIRLRHDGGGKLCVKGSKLGLFIPTRVIDSPDLLITEGETDAAAALSVGLNVVGRPGCGNGTKHLVEFNYLLLVVVLMILGFMIILLVF